MCCAGWGSRTGCAPTPSIRARGTTATGRSGEVLFDILFGAEAEQAYGAPYLLAHRGDLHAALASAVPDEIVRLNHRLTGIDQTAAAACGSRFDNGHVAEADAAIGADGVHSVVQDGAVRRRRAQLHRPHRLSHGLPGRPAEGRRACCNCTKWWGEDRHVVMYPVKPDRSEIYFVTSQPEPGFDLESWSATGDVKVLREAFEAFHPEARAVIDAAPDGAQAAAGRSRSARALGRRQGGAAGRRLPSDDALHGAGRGDGDRGCGDPVALPRRRRPRRHRGGARAATRRRARSGRRRCSSPRARTSGARASPTSTGSTATTPGKRRWRPPEEIPRCARDGSDALCALLPLRQIEARQLVGDRS